jgi:hypothetical protein
VIGFRGERVIGLVENPQQLAKQTVEMVERSKRHIVDGKARNEIGRRLTVLQEVISTL